MGADGGTWDSMDGEIHSRDKTPVPIELVRVNNVNTLLQQASFWHDLVTHPDVGVWLKQMESIVANHNSVFTAATGRPVPKDLPGNRPPWQQAHRVPPHQEARDLLNDRRNERQNQHDVRHRQPCV